MSARKASDVERVSTHGDNTLTDPLQTTVLLVQVEALEEDKAIRDELKKKGYTIKQQALVHLTKSNAHEFIYEVCNPTSSFYREIKNAQQVSSVDDRDPSASEEAKSPITENARTSATPRDKLSTPRGTTLSPRQVNDGGESLEEAVHALASGPVLMLVLQKSNAVADLIELIGPSKPDLWAGTHSSCLRARFGKGKQQVGVRCSAQESTVAHEVDFLLAHSGSQREHGDRCPLDQPSHGRASKKTADVNLDQLLNFLFPAHVLHPNSAGRLFVFALYGPLDSKSRLRSGEKGMHIVTDLELTTMSNRMEREDILSVYKMCSLSQEHEEEVVRQVDQMLKSFPQYTTRDIVELFRSLPRNPNGHMNFHSMQAAIMKERCRRVLCMKELLHPALASPIQNQYRQTLKRIMKTQYEIAPLSFFLKDIGFTGAENATLVSRLLSNHSFQICQLEDGNSPSLTQNVRLLREDIHLPGDKREPWNPSCQMHRK